MKYLYFVLSVTIYKRKTKNIEKKGARIAKLLTTCCNSLSFLHKIYKKRSDFEINIAVLSVPLCQKNTE